MYVMIAEDSFYWPHDNITFATEMDKTTFEHFCVVFFRSYCSAVFCCAGQK